MKKRNLLILVVGLIFLLLACKKEEKNEAPTVSTLEAVDITMHYARLKAVVENENGSAVTLRGFCWSANPDPGLNDSIIDSGFGPGNYDAKLPYMNSGKTYYYKAFATNANGTSFGRELSFTTDNEVDPGPSLIFKGGFGYTFNDAIIPAGSAIKVGVIGSNSIITNNELTRFKFSIISNNITTTFLDSTLSADSFTWETELTFTGVGQARLLFQLWDKVGMMNEKSFDLVIEDPSTTINKFVDVEFGSWNDAAGSFFSSTEGITYTVGQTSTSPSNQAKIDFLFFYGATNKNTMASPDDADANTVNELKLNLWTNKNQTRFNSTNITVAQFDAIGTTYQFPTFNFSSQTTKVNMLEVGDIFLFKTKNNKLGLVKINYLSTPNKGDKSRATIIIQKYIFL